MTADVLGGSESFRLAPDELRFVADWVSPHERVCVEVPGDVAGLIRQRRGEATPMQFCTWDPECPAPGVHRMERRVCTSGLTDVETVCDDHVAAAGRDGYGSRERVVRPEAVEAMGPRWGALS
jgi:hypothetical protein